MGAKCCSLAMAGKLVFDNKSAKLHRDALALSLMPPKKKKKDPNAPKRALSSFMFYSNAVRDTVRKAQPNIPFSEVAKVIGQQWRGLSAEDKKPYDDMATADKARYAQEKKNYTPDVRFEFADGLPIVHPPARRVTVFSHVCRSPSPPATHAAV